MARFTSTTLVQPDSQPTDLSKEIWPEPYNPSFEPQLSLSRSIAPHGARALLNHIQYLMATDELGI
jgi:hypothetical protein